MRPGNFWQYLFLGWIALWVAHAKALPIGQQVTAVFQQTIEGLEGKHPGGATDLSSCVGKTGDLPIRFHIVHSR
jgi:hypothetical protein